MTQPLTAYPWPLTFGVEWEFGVAYLKDDTIPLPHLDDASKILRFTTIDSDYEGKSGYEEKAEFFPHAIRSAIKRSIRNTIKEAGFLVGAIEKDPSEEAEVALWEALDDTSLNNLIPGPYDWTCIEVHSPAYYFTGGSLKAIIDVCRLLSQTYGLSVNSSMALHVHVGDSNNGFDTETPTNIVAFLWAFEPQLNSLHSEKRQDFQFAGSMRESSPYSRGYFRNHGVRPHPLTGVLHFLNCKSTMELIEQANFSEPGQHNFKYSAYNFQGMADHAMGIPKKATIEFRQHRGTLSTEAAVNWIKTVVGIVDYIRKADNNTLLNLFRKVEHEKWEKLGDGEDAEREEKLGPILAESTFTIIDLLSELGLHGPAAYYKDRWVKLPKKPRQPTPAESEYTEEVIEKGSEEASEQVSEEVSETGTNTSQPQADKDADSDLEKTKSELDAENEKLDKEIA
ncbi:putative amidoligase enzyme domain containing protein [Hyaloscypha variabilis]